MRYPYIWLVPLILAVAGEARLAADQFPSTQDTRDEFESFCHRLTDSDNPYYGTGDLRLAESRIEDLPADPKVSAARLGFYGWQLMRVGKPTEAIPIIRRAEGLIASEEDTESRELEHSLIRLRALAHLQAAEDANCLEMHNSASCILPVANEAVHKKPDQARAAGDLFQQLAEADPGDVESRWLLNVSRMITGDYPAAVPPALRLPKEFETPIDQWRWPNLAPALGLDVVDLSGGAIMDDFDGDGRLDIVTTTADPCDTMKAFKNRGLDGFEDVTETWGLDGQLGGLNTLQADYDNDGRLDILILRGGWWGRDGRVRNSLLHNEIEGEQGRFVDVTAAAGLAYPSYPTQTAAWGDYDNDGDLDLYVGNESEGTAVYTSAEFLSEIGTSYPSQLFRNNGDGTFTDVARQAGVANQRFAKAVVWGDVDNDGDIDLFISNIGPNRLYRNRGDGTFVDEAEILGVVEPSGRSFPSWFFDFDNDGRLDLLVADYSADMDTIFLSLLDQPTTGGNPVLYRNTGSGFENVSKQVGLSRPVLPMGANYGDLDNDGWLDLFFSTGVPDYESLMPNAVYRNLGGTRFEEVTMPFGFGHIQKGHGVAFGDLDDDGDQDILHQLGGAYPFDVFANALYVNPGNANHWVILRFEGSEANRFAVGGRLQVRVRDGAASRSIHSLIGSGGSFGASSLQQEIGLGRADEIESIEIVWPGSGRTQVVNGVELDRRYKIVEGESKPIELPLRRTDLATIRPKPRDHNHH
ncbi:MAG: CRTAC1 family protein [Acidobacteriota bacterium]